MASCSGKPIHVLRRVLRNLKIELPKDVAAKSNKVSSSSSSAAAAAHNNNNGASSRLTTPTREFVLQRYRASQNITCPKDISNLRRLASDFLALQEDLKERNRLYELDTGAETILSPKEMSRRAAARAGLQLPDLNPKLD